MTVPAPAARLRPVGPAVIGGVAAAVAAVAVLRPWLRPGDLLVRDLVAVGDAGWSPALLAPSALPREVPGEVLVALLGQVVPAGLVVRTALLVALVAVGAGAGRLAGAGRPTGVHVAAVVAGVAAVWNPYVLARLQQGQWLVVVALAAVPWVVVHLVERDLPRLSRTLALASVAGFLAVVVVVPTLVVGGAALRRWREVGTGLFVVLLLSLPWLVLTEGVVADPDGFAAFAPNGDLAAGVFPSLLTGGGHFNAAVASPWRGGWVVTLVALVLTAVALWGLRRWTGPPAARTALAVAGLLVLVVAAAAATGPGRDLLVGTAETLPVAAAVRDAQRLLAPWTVLLAIGVGTAVAALGDRAAAPVAAAVLGVVLVVVALPDPLIGPRLPAPVALPAAWHEAAAAVDAEPPRPVLVVPYGRTQRYPFTDGRPVHVPFQRLVGAPVLTDGRLEVEDGDGTVLVIDEQADGEELRRVAAGWPDDVEAADLADVDVGWVAVTDPDRMVATAPVGTSLVVSAPTLQLLRVQADVDVVTPPRWLLLLDLVVLLSAVAMVAGPVVGTARTRARNST